MYQVSWNYGSVIQCGRSLHHVDACNETFLLETFLTRLNAEDQMTLYLPISWRGVVLFFLPGLKYRANALHLLAHSVPPQIRSSSRWDFHFHSYVLTIYVRLYWILELVVFYSLVRRGYIRKVNVQLVPKYFSRDCSTDSISCSEHKL